MATRRTTERKRGRGQFLFSLRLAEVYNRRRTEYGPERAGCPSLFNNSTLPTLVEPESRGRASDATDGLGRALEAKRGGETRHVEREATGGISWVLSPPLGVPPLISICTPQFSSLPFARGCPTVAREAKGGELPVRQSGIPAMKSRGCSPPKGVLPNSR
jgi:hypothetical protein